MLASSTTRTCALRRLTHRKPSKILPATASPEPALAQAMDVARKVREQGVHVILDIMLLDLACKGGSSGGVIRCLSKGHSFHRGTDELFVVSISN